MHDAIFGLTTFLALLHVLPMPYITNPQLRKAYSTLGGLFLTSYFLGAEAFLLAIHIFLPFLVLKTLPIRSASIIATVLAAFLLLLR